MTETCNAPRDHVSIDRRRGARALCLALAGTSCDANIDGISSCSKVEDLPYGLRFVLTDASRLPALSFELRWNLSNPTGGRSAFASIGGRESDAQRGPASIMTEPGALEVLPSIPTNSSDLYARVEVDRSSTCVGGASELIHIDVAGRVVALTERDALLRLISFPMDRPGEEANVTLGPASLVARHVDARDGRHGYVVARDPAGLERWTIERIQYRNGARTRLTSLTSTSTPEIFVAPVDRWHVVTCQEGGILRARLYGSFTRDGFDLGPVSVDDDGVARVVTSVDGRYVLTLHDVASPNGDPSSLAKITAIGPAGPLQSRDFRIAGRVEVFRRSPDGKRAAWLTRSRFGVQSLGVLDIENARGLFNIPSTNRGLEVVDFAWSPDGTRVFGVGDLRVDGHVEPFLVNADGRLELLRAQAPRDAVSLSGVRWSPDGSRVAWLARMGSQRLFAMAIPGFVERQISTDEDVLDYRWSSDGRELAWRAQIGGRQGVVRSFADGTERMLMLFDQELTIESLSWDPRNARLLIRSLRGTTPRIDVFDRSVRQFRLQFGQTRSVVWARAFGEESR